MRTKVGEQLKDVELIPENSIEGDSQTNGDIEQCNDYVRGKVKSQVDPASKDAFVGCFRDGNIYWGARQHALQHLAGEGADMTVPRCIALCAQAGAGNAAQAPHVPNPVLAEAGKRLSGMDWGVASLQISMSACVTSCLS